MTRLSLAAEAAVLAGILGLIACGIWRVVVGRVESWVVKWYGMMIVLGLLGVLVIEIWKG